MKKLLNIFSRKQASKKLVGMYPDAISDVASYVLFDIMKRNEQSNNSFVEFEDYLKDKEWGIYLAMVEDLLNKKVATQIRLSKVEFSYHYYSDKNLHDLSSDIYSAYYADAIL